jgi:hypothetical protein
MAADWSGWLREITTPTNDERPTVGAVDRSTSTNEET